MQEKIFSYVSQRCHLPLLWYVCGVLLMVLITFPGLYNHVCEMCGEAVVSPVLAYSVLTLELGGNKRFSFLPEIFLAE